MVGADFSDQYFQAKGMTPEQVSIFIEDRKWDYRGMEVYAHWTRCLT